MKTLVLIVFTFISINSASTYALESNVRTYNISWNCPTNNNSNVPQIIQAVPVAIDKNSGGYESAELDRILDMIEKDEMYDYSYCVSNFLNPFASILGKAPDLINKLTNYLSKARSRKNPIDLNKGFPEHPMYNNITKIAAAGSCEILTGLYPMLIVNENYKKIISSFNKNNDYCKENIPYMISEAMKTITPNKDFCELNASDCSKRLAELENIRLYMLNRPEFASSADLFSDTIKNKVENCPDVSNKAIENLDNEVKQATSCKTPTVGESVFAHGNKGSGVSSEYVLKRLPDENGKKVFESIVDFDFGNANNNEMKTKFVTCFDEIKDNLFDENGNVLKVRLAEQADKYKPSIVNINVFDSEFRQDSGTWKKTIDCPTLVHETFHHMGLVDEYKETSRGYIVNADGNTEYVNENAAYKAYDCRHLGPVDSIMHAQKKAYDRIKSDSPYIELEICECEFDSSKYNDGIQMQHAFENSRANCAEIFSNMASDATSCPPQTKFKKYNTKENDRSSLNFLTQDNNGKILRETKLSVSKKPLLFNAQFKYIIQPGCKLENKLYYKCSIDAYKTSSASYGRDTCLADKSECNKGNFEWLR